MAVFIAASGCSYSACLTDTWEAAAVSLHKEQLRVLAVAVVYEAACRGSPGYVHCAQSHETLPAVLDRWKDVEHKLESGEHHECSTESSMPEPEKNQQLSVTSQDPAHIIRTVYSWTHGYCIAEVFFDCTRMNEFIAVCTYRRK